MGIPKSSRLNSGRDIVKKLGPGLITGAADDDPSGIAAYSQAGAQFGVHMLWTVLFTYPFMAAIQMISAQIGRVSGQGIAANIKQFYPKFLLYVVVALLVFANTINIAADISAMGNAVNLVMGGPAPLYSVLLGVVSLLLQIFIPYSRYVRVLKWLTLALLAYVATLFVIHVPWLEVLYRSFWPKIEWRSEYLTTVVAVFGTTISPYLFFWQASQEVEEEELDPNAHALRAAPQEVRANFDRIKLDTLLGMGFSNLVAFFIILTTAITLHQNGIFDIKSSEDAARALRPLAGNFAFYLFSAGIVGTGLLAVPVLAGSSAYATAEAFGWEHGLERKYFKAKGFYAIITVSILGGVLLGLTGMDPIRALYWSAVINGVISVPIMLVMMLLASNPQVMGDLVIKKSLKIFGWLSVLVMFLAVVAMFATL